MEEPPGEQPTDASEITAVRRARSKRLSREVRSFFTEVIIVIIGVLIALLVNQAVDAYQWRQRVDTIRTLMRAELGADDAPQAYQVLSQYRCRIEQLDALDAATRAGDSARFAAIADRYAVPSVTWDDHAWRMVYSGDVPSHMPPEELESWSAPYNWIDQLQTLQARERQDVYALRGLAAGASATVEDRAAMAAAIRRLRDDNDVLSAFAAIALKSAVIDLRVPLKLTPHQLSYLRGYYGACVAPPDLSRMQWQDYPTDLRGVLAWMR